MSDAFVIFLVCCESAHHIVLQYTNFNLIKDYEGVRGIENWTENADCGPRHGKIRTGTENYFITIKQPCHFTD